MDLSLTGIREQSKNNSGFDLLDQTQVPYQRGNSSVLIEEESQVVAEKPNKTGKQFARKRSRTKMDNVIKLQLQSDTRRKIATASNGEKIVADGSRASIREWGISEGFDMLQQQTFEVITSTFVLTYIREAQKEGERPILPPGAQQPASQRRAIIELKEMGAKEQLIMFMTGPGGCGKSKIIHAVQDYAACFCKQLHMNYDNRTVVVTATTGVAATAIFGETTHSAFGLARKEIDVEEIKKWVDVRLAFVDEVSMLSQHLLKPLDENCRTLREQRRVKYGGMNIVFSGDFHQLKPVKGIPLYEKHHSLWHGALNSFVELDGMWRFKNDLPWGNLLMRLRQGHQTREDMAVINERLIQNESDLNLLDSNTNPNEQIKYGCHTNKERNAIHAGLFVEHIQQSHRRGGYRKRDTLIIRGRLFWRVTSNRMSAAFARLVYENCGDSNCGTASSLVDPFLCLTKGCRIMLTENTAVEKGLANGTTCRFLGIKMKEGKSIGTQKLGGYNVQSVYADQVDFMQCEHCSEDRVGTDGKPIKFRVYPNTYKNTTADIPVDMLDGKRIPQRVNIVQFPVIKNEATTCYKLQGATLTRLLVSEIYLSLDWLYVMLSRVKERANLYLRKPIKEDAVFEVDEILIKHEDWLRKTISMK